MNTMMRPAPASMLRPAIVGMCPRRVAVRAASDSSQSTPAGPPSHLVATLLVQKEEELKQMIAPGQLAPRAAVIAAKRKEIAALRAQLKSTVAANLPPTLASDLPIPSSTPVAPPTPSPAMASAAFAAASTSAPVLGKPATSRPPTGLGGRDALLLVEHQLSVASGSGSADEDILIARGRNALHAVEQSLSLGLNRAAAVDEMAEFEALQQEHMLLKARLEALQERQRQLEIIKKRVESGKAAQKIAVEEEKEEESGGAPKRRTTKARTTKASKSDSESDSESAAKPKAKRIYKKKDAGVEAVPRQKAVKKADQALPSMTVSKALEKASA